jgi:deazaflavin-dependent oxidoreductase (nitroreductase family)
LIVAATERSGPSARALRRARLARLATRVRPLQARFTWLHARLLRLFRGRWRRSLLLAGGQPVLALTTTGRRTGRRRSTPVAYMPWGDAYVITAANLGDERPPHWFGNLMANPDAEVHVHGRRQPVRARRAEAGERERLWAEWLHRLPASEAFQEIAGREIPVVVLEPWSAAAPPS